MTKTKGTDNTETLGLPVVCINLSFPPKRPVFGSPDNVLRQEAERQSLWGSSSRGKDYQEAGFAQQGPHEVGCHSLSQGTLSPTLVKE